VQIWHGFPVGSSVDIIARIIQPGLSERLGQPVIIDMKPGASGRIATAFVAKQPPDGYTLIMLTGADGVMAATMTDLPYDLLRDFAFVSTTAAYPFVILVLSDSPYQTLGQLIEDARKRPGKLSYGHSGAGSALHLAGELLKAEAGIDLVHVPYKGGPQVLQELAAGRLDMAVGVPSSAMPLIKAGRLRVLAVTSLKRDPSFPDVPAVDETVPGYEVTSWLGLAAPAGTSQTTVDRLSTEVRAVLAREDVAARMRAIGVEPVGMTSGEFRARVEADIHKWRRLAAKVNLQ